MRRSVLAGSDRAPHRKGNLDSIEMWYCDVWKQLIQLHKTRKARIVITARGRSKHTTWNNLCGACCINCDGELSRRGTRLQIEQEITDLNNVCFVKSEMNSKSLGNFWCWALLFSYMIKQSRCYFYYLTFQIKCKYTFNLSIVYL